MDELEILFDEAQQARQAIVVERAKIFTWLEKQLELPRQNPEGYDRLRLELGLRETGLAMLSKDSEERHARYEKALLVSNRRWNRIILGANIALAVLMLAATIVMAIATMGIWRDSPKSLPPSGEGKAH